MSSNSNNQLKIFYKIKNTNLKELSLDINKATFGDIIIYFKNNIETIYPQFRLKSKYFFNGKELDYSNQILLLLMSKNIKAETIKQINLEIFLNEIYNIHDEKTPNYSKIFIPNKTNNSFEIYMYFPNKGIIDIEVYNNKIFNDYFLNKINFKTSYCNSINYFFLSGGEYNNEIIDDFWIIDKSIYSVKHMNLPSPKSGHSMLPINNNYILIMGGNDSKAYLFNIEKNDFSNFENTNKIHFEPSLFLWNNYIYCFSEENKSIIAEKILFLKENQKWENISLNIVNDNELLFNLNNEKNEYEYENILIILGGENNIIYNPLNNNIKKINDLDFDICIGDKNFYKINKYFNICIPDDFINEKHLIVLNKKYRYFHKMKFTNTLKKIKTPNEENEKITDENNIKIKVELDNNTNIQIENDNDNVNDNENTNNNDNIQLINEDENNNSTEDLIFKLLNSNKSIKTPSENINSDSANIGSGKEIIINENFTFKKKENDESSKSNLIIPKNILNENLIPKTSDLNERITDENETKLIPKNSLSSSLKISDNMINIKEDNKNENIIFNNEIIPGNENNNEKEIDKLRETVKSIISFHISQDSLDGQLINKELLNNINDENNEDNKINEIKNQEEEKNIEYNFNSPNTNEGNLDDVFSFDAVAMNGEEIQKKDETRSSNIFKSNVNMTLSENSEDEKLKDKTYELDKNNEKEINNNENK